MELHRRKLEPMILYQTGSYTPLFPDSQSPHRSTPPRRNTCLSVFHLAASALARAPVLCPGRWWLGSQRLKSCACPFPFATRPRSWRKPSAISGVFRRRGLGGALRRVPNVASLSHPRSLVFFVFSRHRRRGIAAIVANAAKLRVWVSFLCMHHLGDAGEPSEEELNELNQGGENSRKSARSCLYLTNIRGGN